MKLFRNKTEELAKECRSLLYTIKSETDRIHLCEDLLNRLNADLKTSMAYQQLSLLATHKGKTLKDISKDVFVSYPKATGFLRDVQNCNLLLLSDFKKFCDGNNIKFWLHAGTLIGALRNNGFIQWDDDADVAMTRDDFNIMRKKIQDSSLLELNEYYNDITCSRQYQLKYKQKDIPVFIDVVMYDTCLAVRSADDALFWTQYRSLRQELVNNFREKIGNTPLIDIGYYHVGLYPPDVKKKVDELIDTANQKICPESIPLSEKPSFFYAMENYPFTYPIMKYDDLFPLKEIPFEGMSFLIPANPEQYLLGYGNIWLPPEDMGKTPHLYAFQNSSDAIKKFLNERNGND